MKHLLIVASFVFAAGCGKGGLDGKLDELGKIKDAMCACKDKACADEQHEKYTAWKKGNSKDDKPSDEQMKKFEAIRKDMNDCRHKLEGPPGGDTGAPPPTGGSAAPAPTTPPANP
jgi:hypothetical protein